MQFANALRDTTSVGAFRPEARFGELTFGGKSPDMSADVRCDTAAQRVITSTCLEHAIGRTDALRQTDSATRTRDVGEGAG
jgi:hypothetical protein